MKYLSVCSGIEAATVAWHPLGWTPAAFSEIEPFPCSVLAHHYPTVPNLGDMTKFKEWNLDPIDLLVGGTPCQSFSVAGLRKGLDDPRGNLMLTYLAIADKYRPRWLVWENVPGVLSSNGGKDFGTFLGGLGELGYGFAYRVLDAQYFGVAQRRRRVFVVGCLGDWRGAAAVLFERDSMQGNPAPSRQARKDVAPTLSARTKGGGGLGTDFDCDGGLVMPTLDQRAGRSGANSFATSGDLIHAPEVARCVATREGSSQDWETTTMIAHAIQAGATRENPSSGPDGVGVQENLAYTLEARAEVQMVAHSLRGEGFDASEDGTGRGTPLVPVSFNFHKSGNEGSSLGVAEDRTDCLRADTKSPFAVAWSEELTASIDVAGTIQRGGSGGRHDGVMTASSHVRRLTPVECERLQGFPDSYTNVPHRGKPAADGPRYKALGNSMAVPVMAFIGSRIDQVEQVTAALKSAA